MTFNELEAVPSVMRAGNTEEFANLSDSELKEVQHEGALAVLKQDLMRFLAIDYATLDKAADYYADKYEDILSAALSYKQVALYYQDGDAGEGSKAARMDKKHEKLYTEKLSSLAEIVANSTKTRSGGSVLLMR